MLVGISCLGFLFNIPDWKYGGKRSNLSSGDAKTLRMTYHNISKSAPLLKQLCSAGININPIHKGIKYKSTFTCYLMENIIATLSPSNEGRALHVSRDTS